MRYYGFVVVTCRKKKKKCLSCVILRFIITKYYHRILNTANLYRQYKRRASIPYENGVSKSFEKKNDNILTDSLCFILHWECIRIRLAPSIFSFGTRFEIQTAVFYRTECMRARDYLNNFKIHKIVGPTYGLKSRYLHFFLVKPPL